MILKYISLGLNYDYYIKNNNEIRYNFQTRSRYICNYLSRAIRKFKFDTGGIFDMISIDLLPADIVKKPEILESSKILKIYLPFDEKDYFKALQNGLCDYFLEQLNNGFNMAAKFRPIPLPTLEELIFEFKIGGCKNTWVHKRKRFKEQI